MRVATLLVAALAVGACGKSHDKGKAAAPPPSVPVTLGACTIEAPAAKVLPAGPGSRASLALGAPEVTGLEVDPVRRFFGEQAGALKGCYEAELVTSPSLAGTLTIDVTLNDGGDILTLDARGVDPAVDACVARRLRMTMAFAPARGEKSARIHIALTLRPPKTQASAGAPAAAPAPEVRTVANPMAPLTAELGACFAARTAQPPGTAEIRVAMGDGGLVSAVEVQGVTDRAAISCVTRVVRQAVWPEGDGAYRCAVSYGAKSP